MNALIQVVLVLRWVDDDLQAHEEFMGLYNVPTIEASTLTSMIKDSLVRFNLSLSKARGQCYDGASNMSGRHSGVAKKIQDEEPRALFTHCYGHSLNLAASDTVKKCKVLKTALEMSHEIVKLVKYSPRRETLFRSIKEEFAIDGPGIRVLCPTRWTVRADSMASIIKNYAVLQSLWDQALSIVHDTETIARINGVSTVMKKFEFYFGLVLGEMILRHTDNLSKTLQNKRCSAAEGHVVAHMTKVTLSSLRYESNFKLFWAKVVKMVNDVDVGDPELPRQRRRPARYEFGSASAEFHSSPESFYRQFYFEAIDLIVQTINDRFDQLGYKMYQRLEALIIKAANKETFAEDLDYVASFYGSDIDKLLLETQLKTLGANISSKVTNIFDVRDYLLSMTSAERKLLNEVMIMMKLICVMPATNSSSERSFSAMRRVKSYLRSTMKQERLNHLMALHIHKDVLDSINLSHVANDFVSNSEHRQKIFGQFHST